MAAVLMCQFDGFAAALAKKVQLCTPCFATANRLYIHDIRAVQRKDSFHTFVAHHTPNCEGFVDSATSTGDYGTGKHLNPFLITLPDPASDINGIANFEVRYIFF